MLEPNEQATTQEDVDIERDAPNLDADADDRMIFWFEEQVTNPSELQADMREVGIL